MLRRWLVLPLLGLGLVGCHNFSKLDYTSLHNRAGWQRPERVVETLEIQPGEVVADLGAGDGYFLPYFTEAVGPSGVVYAVEVEEEKARNLEELVAREGYTNVVVVLGEYGDPHLPDGSIDTVFLCNTYHHIESRPAYFAALRADLDDDGRVAVLEPNGELGGILSLALDEGHTSSADEVVAEMQSAGYRRSDSHDFLPTQIFEVFAPEASGD